MTTKASTLPRRITASGGSRAGGKAAPKPGSLDALRGIHKASKLKLAHIVEQGLPASALDELCARIQMPKKIVTEHLGLALRTVDHKRKNGLPLSADETASVVRMALISQMAGELFTSPTAIKDWITTPDPALNGRTPLSMLSTEFGADAVKDLLNGMSHGFAA